MKREHFENPIYKLVLKACAESVTISDKCSGAFLRKEAIRSLANRLYAEFREAAKISRDEWEKAFAEGPAFRDTDREASYVSDDVALNCPACKGSGHIGDVTAPTGEQAGEVVEPTWPVPWNAHRYPVDVIAEAFGKSAVEASSGPRLGRANFAIIGFTLLQQLGARGFGICRDQPLRAHVPIEADYQNVGQLVPRTSPRNDYEVIVGWNACRKAMLAAAPAPGNGGEA